MRMFWRILTSETKIYDSRKRPAEPALPLFPPDTYGLVLVGQVEPVPVVVVEGPHSAKLLSKKVLGATLGSQDGTVAR